MLLGEGEGAAPAAALYRGRDVVLLRRGGARNGGDRRLQRGRGARVGGPGAGPGIEEGDARRPRRLGVQEVGGREKGGDGEERRQEGGEAEKGDYVGDRRQEREGEEKVAELGVSSGVFVGEVLDEGLLFCIGIGVSIVTCDENRT